MKKIETVIPKDQKFDAAICLGQVFSHLTTNKDLKTCFSGVCKMLRKNGVFVFSARNARKISEEYLNKLLLGHMVNEEKLQLLLLNYSTRHPRNRNVIIWRPIYLMKEKNRVDLQIKEHKLRWFHFSMLKKMLTENRFEIIATYSGPSREEFDENKHTDMWFVTTTK